VTQDSAQRLPRLAVYAGVFDPPTLAHLEIIERALGLFDQLVVVVAVNSSKAQPMFSGDERVELMRASLTEAMQPRVDVVQLSGLVAPYASRLGACALVRGMRPGTDPDHEIALAGWNERLEPSLATVLLVSSSSHVYLSSSFVRETALLGGGIVPGSVSPAVEAALKGKFPPHMSVNGEAREAAAGAEAQRR
jgi:pantetheine-phosphate adenylyltransferase